MCCFGLLMKLQKDVAKENNTALTEGSWPRIQDKGTFALEILWQAVQAVLTSAAKYGYWHLCVSCHCWLFKFFIYCRVVRLGSNGAALGCSTRLVGFQRGITSKTQLEVKSSQFVLGVMHVPSVCWKEGLKSRTKAL